MAQQVYDDEILGKAFDAGLTRKALVFIRPYWKTIGLAFFTMLLTTAATLSSPQIVRYAIDQGMGKSDAHAVGAAALAYILVWLLYLVSQNRQSVIISWLGQQVIFDIRKTLFAHIQNLSLDFFDKREIGRIISRLTSDIDALNQMLTTGGLTLFVDIFTTITVVIVLVRMNLKLTLMILTLTPFIWIVTSVFRSKARVAYRDIRRKVATVTAHVAENVSGVKVVKSFSREGENLRRFKRVNQENRDAIMYAVKIGAIFGPTIEMIFAIGTCMILWYGGVKIAQGTLTVGELAGFSLYLNLFFDPIRRMSAFYQTMQGAMAGAERIFEILDTKSSVADKPNAIILPRVQGDVEFDKVHFAYGEKPVLQGLSFSAKAGETIAVVGPTGAGKTTIISLLGRQYEIQDGSIRIDGTDIRDVTLKSLRRQIGVVLQDSFLFPGTVRENIRYGRLDATDQEVEAAAKAVGAHEFISKMAKGYEEHIHEGASNISSGQKQLMSFARVLLADPRILVLDEATSSIDTATELLIQEALRKLLEGRTSFVIAHRLSTISEADKIMVIQDGQLVEIGTHAELLERAGLYRKLHDIQFAADQEIAGGL
jgi:ABC-type multidrug transport system fused ATPase/permease subunit